MSNHEDPVIVWFRRDLRVTDHPALHDAVRYADAVVPLFVMEDRLLSGRMASPARTWFLERSLLDLDTALRVRGSGLLIRRGRPDEVVPQLAHQIGARTVVASRDVTPFSFRRDQAVSQALERDGRRLVLKPGLLLSEPEDVRASSGDAYKTFTPFWRALQRSPRRELLAAPRRIPAHPITPVRAGLDEASFSWPSPPLDGLPVPGEAAAQERLRAWTTHGISGYGDGRNDLAGAATSHLGADLHLGTLSPLQVETGALDAGVDVTPFVRQLAWREFYQHLLFGRRHGAERTADGPLMSAFRTERDDPAAVAAWRTGRTGIPVVDAGMRQLAAAAWISNRARLVVASFLTRHLLMDYRIGERHFMQHLVDGDVANNLGGWQWTAGVGADPQPWFRIFNPVLQGRRFDPDGAWVRRWVPELARVPVRHIHAPWEMPDAVAAEARVRLGVDYPLPVVDLKEGRERALAAFRAATSG